MKLSIVGTSLLR